MNKIFRTQWITGYSNFALENMTVDTVSQTCGDIQTAAVGESNRVIKEPTQTTNRSQEKQGHASFPQWQGFLTWRNLLRCIISTSGRVHRLNVMLPCCSCLQCGHRHASSGASWKQGAGLPLGTTLSKSLSWQTSELLSCPGPGITQHLSGSCTGGQPMG